jgi:hypothetical protein
MEEINEKDMLEGLAEILAELKPTQRKKLEVLMNARARGIKKTRIVDKLSFETVGDDDDMSEYEEDTDLDSSGAILHKKTSRMKLFDCGHPASRVNFGHKAECGHTICRECVEKYNLICAYPGCLKKLCSRPKCYSRMVGGQFYCVKHGRWELIHAVAKSIRFV